MLDRRTVVSEDAFSSGQVGSKLWLCERLADVLGDARWGNQELTDLESLKDPKGLVASGSSMDSKGSADSRRLKNPKCSEYPRSEKHENIWIYGGWQGVLGFMLLSRPEFRNATVRSFDFDPACEKIANVICENWVWREWQFRAFTKDCNELDPKLGEFGQAPSIVINTSVEHFDRRDWFEKIPRGTLVALQASDFDHDGAVSLFKSEESLRTTYPLEKVLFSGKMNFDYGKWSFNRFMLIGVK